MELYGKYLKQIQNKIEKLELKKEGRYLSKPLSSLEFNKILDELRVLREIEEFLWNKL